MPDRIALLVYNDSELKPIAPYTMLEGDLKYGSKDWEFFKEFLDTQMLEFVSIVNGGHSQMLVDEEFLLKPHKSLSFNTVATGFYYAGHIIHRFLDEEYNGKAEPRTPILGRAVILPTGVTT